MSEPIPEELLSAYLDGELSSEELVRVEQHLEQDAESRRTLAELHEIRDALKSLPAETLTHDFAARIVGQIAASSRNVHANAAKVPDPTVRRAANRSRTRLATILAAVAAMIVIGAWGIRYLPAPKIASRPKEKTLDPQQESRAEAVASESLADDKMILDSVASHVELELAKPPAAADVESLASSPPTQPLREAINSAKPERTSRKLANSSAGEAESDYGLVVDFQLDTTQSVELAKTWGQWKSPVAPTTSEDVVTEYVVVGTHREIAQLLAGVPAKSSRISGPSMAEFDRRGLSFYTVPRSDEVLAESSSQSLLAEDSDAFAGGPRAADLPTLNLNQQNASRARTITSPTPATPSIASQRVSASGLGKSSTTEVDGESREAKANVSDAGVTEESPFTAGKQAEPRIRVLVRVRLAQ